MMDLEALEKGLETNKRYDMIKTPININDIVCVSEGSYGGSNWLNRGIVIEKMPKGIKYIDLDTKDIKKVLDISHKLLVITKNYSSDEINSFKALVKEVYKKKEEDRIKSIRRYLAFKFEKENEAFILSHEEHREINKDVFNEIIDNLKEQYKDYSISVWIKGKNFAPIENVKFTKVVVNRRTSILGYSCHKIELINNHYKPISNNNNYIQEYNIDREFRSMLINMGYTYDEKSN